MGERVFCDISTWDPDESTWMRLIQLVEPEEQVRIGKFRRPGAVKGSPALIGRQNPDARLSLVGRLLLRRAAIRLGCEPSLSSLWTRTPYRRPVLFPEWARQYEGFNASISHAGDAVVFVSERDLLCGVDLMPIELPPGAASEAELFQQLNTVMTASEWTGIRQSASPLRAFYQHWTVKEAYVKALGVGLGMELHRIEPTSAPAAAAAASLCVDGRSAGAWRVGWHAIGGLYVVAVAAGPLDDAPSDIRQALALTSAAGAGSDALRCEEAVMRSFEMLDVNDLVAQTLVQS
jgi:4'-phosphopantetheinyl transferase